MVCFAAFALTLAVGSFPLSSSALVSPQETTEAQADVPPAIADVVAGLRRIDGLLTQYWDDDQGQLWWELPPPDADGVHGTYLLVDGLASGFGSNPLGLDRSRLGPSRLVRIRRVGPTVLIEQLNTRFRASTASRRERLAVAQSFTSSVLFGTERAAEDAAGRVLIDVTPFLLRDAQDVAGTLKRREEGTFSLDASRCAIEPSSILGFPDNLEIDALLTWTGQGAGAEVRSTSPSSRAWSLRLHHSLIRLPDDGYRPRRAHPNIGLNAVSFQDYAAPLDAPLRTSYVMRHRLERLDPTAERSRVRTPIVYYVDSGAPLRIRDALIEGASWWVEAFEAAGFVDAFRVEVLPDGVHPLDVRYHVIHWVHRATRGWSYGGSIHDPRTGEILKGNVLLGSLRVRQDRLLFEALAGAGETGSGAPNDPLELALARIRQLSAHEVGHTLGLAHNFAASTDGRASVMDYPAPWIRMRDGRLDVSSAYDVGVGAWDVHTIRYGYVELPRGVDEDEALRAIVADGAGMPFVSDADARSMGSAHPLGHLWDNGSDPVASLREVLDVRRQALEGFGLDRLAPGRPQAELEEVFALVYLYHRYQVDAVSKLIGGVDYRYAVVGDGGAERMQPVALERQVAAFDALLACLDPQVLRIADDAAAFLVPRGFGVPSNREQFASATGPTFDVRGAELAAASQVFERLFHPQRIARVLQQRSGTEARALYGRLRVALAPVAGADERAESLRSDLDALYLRHLVRLAETAPLPAVKSFAFGEAMRFRQSLEGREGDAAHHLRHTLDHWTERGVVPTWPAGRTWELPPGSPIGCACGGDG